MARFIHCLRLYIISLFMIPLCHLINNLDATEDNPDLSFDILYTNGINSYLENDWASCTSYLELSLNDWHWWNKNIARCRKKCYNEANSVDLIFPNSTEYEMDQIFEKLVMNTLCLVKCKNKVFGPRAEKNPPPSVIAEFEKKKPYDYLQLCYYKNGLIDKAAAAAATLLDDQPDHEAMLLNLKYYLKQGGLEPNDIVSMEVKDYITEFLEGDRLYVEQKYLKAIIHLEKSLDLFFESLQECRILCENPFDMGWFPDFVSSVANHYTFTLRCKIKCSQKLSSSYGEEGGNFITSLFNYLQFSFYKVGNLRKACEAVESILLFTPDDSNQIKNKEFYRNEGAVEEFFTPRKKLVDYKQRRDLEEKMLHFIEESFTPIADGSENRESGGQETLIPSISDALFEIAQLFGDDPLSRKPFDKEEL